jgi:hypothetical protein
MKIWWTTFAPGCLVGFDNVGGFVSILAGLDGIGNRWV